MTRGEREAKEVANEQKDTASRFSVPSGKRRSAIALLTDFGAAGFYAGAMKGAVLAADPGAVVIDVTHGIRPYAVAEASFALSAVFEYWAPGTVFVAVVDPGVGGERRNVFVRSRGRAVVCPDNGVVSDVASRFGIDRAYAIDEAAAAAIRRHRPAGRTFLGRDVFAPVAAFLAAGGDDAAIGTPVEDLDRLALPVVEVRDGYVRGESRYADDYGNLLTNVSKDDIARAFGRAPLEEITALIAGGTAVESIGRHFAAGAAGDLMVILDSWDLLEIAVREGSASERFPRERPVVIELSSRSEGTRQG
jgi:S-adenosylmethionine hydrolase